jgi:hypothetical protein
MNWGSWALWGFVATVVLTSILAGSRGLGWTRMDITYLLGTIFTPNRDRAKLLGIFVHLLNGWIFSLVYVAAFNAWGRANWWLGTLVGLVHATFVLVVTMSILPAMHPRMASEQHGPTVVRQLEPPGFLALHYGFRTPLAMLIAHLVFGAILGAFYTLP